MMKKLKPETISKYYEDHFPLERFTSLIDKTDFHNREFGFVVGEDRFVRNISFHKPKEMLDFMIKNSVKHAYVGAVYETPPSKDFPIQKIKWKYREFIFDIDIDEYDAYNEDGKYVGVRTCGCKGDVFCKDCWSLVQEAMVFIDKTMKEDFGFKEIMWFYSGRRGVHAWILDKITRDFDQPQRLAILDYLTFVHDKKRTQSIEEIPNEAKPLRNRIYALVAKSYLEKSFLPSLLHPVNPLLQCKKCNSKIKAYEIISEAIGKEVKGMSFGKIESSLKEYQIKCPYCHGVDLENFSRKELEEELEKLNEFGLTENKAKQILRRIKEIDNFDHNQYNILIPENTKLRKYLSNQILLYRYPRIDRKVTMDTRRVSRMPFSVHGKTGQIAIDITKNIRDFYPDSAPQVQDFF